MSVGGFIVEILDTGDRLWVNTQEKPTRDRCAVYCDKNEESLQMKPGDSFWWQGGNCYWTPMDRSRRDVKIPKRSGSGVNRPPLPQPEGKEGR